MPDKTVALLVRFLEQGKGKLSERAKIKAFEALTEAEIATIENKYQERFSLILCAFCNCLFRSF